jgi:predicted dienelactone hydrolase
MKETTIIQRRLLISLFVLSCVGVFPDFAAAQDACPQINSTLPRPTGPFKVGRTTYHVVDHAAKARDASEGEFIVYMWYPADADSSGSAALYLPVPTQARDAVASSVRRLLGAAYCSFEQNRISAYAIENPRIAKSEKPYSLLLFLPGLGVTGLAYTAQIEDLASHGYAVAAVEYAPIAPFVMFPEGRVTNYDAQRWSPLSQLPEGSLDRTNFEKKEIQAAATALRIVLDDLSEPGRNDRPLTPHLDFSKVGVFGHSFGGMAVLRAVQLDGRFRAGLSQDALIHRTAPAGETGIMEKLFTGLPLGSTDVSVGSPQFVHMSFSDLPLLRAGDDAARMAALRNLTVVREVTRRFFDSALRGSTASMTILSSERFPELKVRTRE